jgi:hypothetical protein
MERGYFDRRGVENLFSKNSETGAYSKEVFCLAVLELWHRISRMEAICPSLMKAAYWVTMKSILVLLPNELAWAWIVDVQSR